ncbi:MAG: hypothetical protein WBO29_13145 [Albidovulum sp.]
MRGFFANVVTATVSLSRIIGTIAILTAAIFAAPEKANSQTNACKELVVEIAAQQQLIGIFGRLEYEIRGHFLLEANAILSTYGGWDSVDRLSCDDACKFRTKIDEYKSEIIGVRRNIGRNTAVTDEELQSFDGAVEVYQGLIETGDQIAKALEDGRVDDANQIYFEIARPNYLQVHGTMYTLIATAERRVAAMARTQCN